MWCSVKFTLLLIGKGHQAHVKYYGQEQFLVVHRMLASLAYQEVYTEGYRSYYFSIAHQDQSSKYITTDKALKLFCTRWGLADF